MKWEQRLKILRWRSLEEADAGGELLPLEERLKATSRAREKLRADEGGGDRAGEVDDFLLRRSRLLNERAEKAGQDSELAQQDAKSLLPWALFSWALVIAAGFGLTALGAEREINLLALPLVGLLLWNAVVMLGSIVLEFLPRRSGAQSGGWVTTLANWLAGKRQPDASEEGIATKTRRETVLAAARGKFAGHSKALVMERLAGRGRAWLHVAAALLALGSCAGMYAKGWSREYLAVWESTLLRPKQAESFFLALFGPASKASGIAVPVGDVIRMQRIRGAAMQPADARPWIHLYSTTLVLFIVLPRLLLAVWTTWQTERRTGLLWRTMGWEPYAQRLLRAVEGTGERVPVLLLGVVDGGMQRERWLAALQERLGGQVSAEFQMIPAGDEDEFAEGWTPQAHVAFLLFQLATTPEDEVQGRLAHDLRAKLRAKFADARLIVLLDATSASERWTPEHMESRQQLWSRMMGAAADEIECIAMPKAVNRL